MYVMSSKVGDLIKKRREELGITIVFCSNNLKIQSRYLEGIENDNYSMFENSIQAQGFVQNYLELLGLNTVTLIPRWRKDVLDFFKEDDLTKLNYFKPKKKRKINIVLTTEKLINVGFLSLIVIFFIFILINYSNNISAPKLQITKPDNNSIVEVDLLDIFGVTDKDAKLRLNNDEIQILPDGNFSTSIKLSEGINNFKFTATNPYNRETSFVLQVIYRPKVIEVYNPPVESIEKVKVDTVPATKPAAKITTLPATLPTKKVN